MVLLAAAHNSDVVHSVTRFLQLTLFVKDTPRGLFDDLYPPPNRHFTADVRRTPTWDPGLQEITDVGTP